MADEVEDLKRALRNVARIWIMMGHAIGRNSDGSAAGPLGKVLDLLATKEVAT
jgi:hypothetical protein